jgi:hypothetical protein
MQEVYGHPKLFTAWPGLPELGSEGIFQDFRNGVPQIETPEQMGR